MGRYIRGFVEYHKNEFWWRSAINIETILAQNYLTYSFLADDSGSRDERTWKVFITKYNRGFPRHLCGSLTAGTYFRTFDEDEYPPLIPTKAWLHEYGDNYLVNHFTLEEILSFDWDGTIIDGVKARACMHESFWYLVELSKELVPLTHDKSNNSVRWVIWFD